MTDSTPAPDHERTLTAGLPRAGAAAADVAAVLVFALLARIAHNTPEMPLSVGGWLGTAWPFVLGTLLAWGAIAAGLLHAARGSVLLVWLSTVVVGLLVWGVRHGQVPHWSFVLVASLMSALLIVGWRWVAGRFRR